MTRSNNTYNLITHKQSRFRMITACILVFMLFLPVEYVFGTMCSMDKHADADITTGTCCPHTGESGTDTDCHSEADSGTTMPGTTIPGTGIHSDTIDCDSNTRVTHHSCENNCCYFEPASEGRANENDGITINQAHPGFYVDRETPLFTIPVITYRERLIPGPDPAPIPIYLTNQVFLN